MVQRGSEGPMRLKIEVALRVLAVILLLLAEILKETA